MKLQKNNKSIHFTEKFEDEVQIHLTKLQPDHIERDFLEMDFQESTKTLYCHLGKLEKLNSKKLRSFSGTITNWLRKHEIKKVNLTNETMQLLIDQDWVEPFFEGLLIGGYQFDQYKQNKKDEWLLSIFINNKFTSFEKRLSEIDKLAQAINLARDLGNEPANVINPVSLAKFCAEMAGEIGLETQVLDENDFLSMQAEGILSVGKGSNNQPRMIILEHKGGNPDVNPTVLVGKAITFDTGGYSLKGVEGIQGMKFDKLGGITVIGFMAAAALLKLPFNIVGIVCAAENMISDHAYRPDDIIKTLSGKTIEIITTDAEGRLVLADGLTYAQTKFKPSKIIDFATLTGGVVVALGNVRAGLFSNNDDLANKLIRNGDSCDEKVWRLPLDEEYTEFIKGEYADLKNSGGRKGHPIMGGIFLKQFIQDEIPWAHIDIAGVATTEKPDGINQKGANGFGIRLLVEFFNNGTH